MRRVMFGFALVAAAVLPLRAELPRSAVTRINEAAQVLKEIHAVPEKDIPQELWEKTDCVIVIPGLKKAAFGIGGEYGKGVMSCRNGQQWSAPIFMKLAKGSWGFQIGAQSIDLVLLVMNESGVDKMLSNKVSLGAEASVAAGPVGRDARAGTDLQLKSEILAYSRAQGLFAGIDLSGGVLQPDDDDNKDAYGSVAPRQVLHGAVQPPAGAAPFMTALKRANAGN